MTAMTKDHWDDGGGLAMTGITRDDWDDWDD